ncbi:MAG: hypothetical protein AAF206_05150 [Bacteroidota bacterium]
MFGEGQVEGKIIGQAIGHGDGQFGNLSKSTGGALIGADHRHPITIVGIESHQQEVLSDTARPAVVGADSDVLDQIRIVFQFEEQTIQIIDKGVCTAQRNRQHISLPFGQQAW